MCDICSEEQAPLVPELLLLKLGGGVQLQLAPHPLPLPLWAGLRSDEIIPVAFRTLRATHRGPWSPIYGICIFVHLDWNFEDRFNICCVVVLSVSQVEVEILHRFSKQMHSRLHRVSKSNQISTTFSHLVLLQKCQCVLNPNLILKVALDSGK